MIVVSPESPGGASAAGIFVEDGITTKGAPPRIVALAPVMIAGDGKTAANVVGAVTTMKGCPPITTVWPWSPAGTAAKGIVVGVGIMITGSLLGGILSDCFGSGEGPGGWLICGVILAGAPPMIELISEPIATESSSGELVMGGVAGVVGG